MLQLICRAAVSLAAAVALVAPAAATGAAVPGDRAPNPRWAEITRIDGGFRYVASKYDSRLTITRVGNRVVFHDRAMRRFRAALPGGCRAVAIEPGIAASCRIPATATPSNPLQLEIVPQGGNDRVDGSALGAAVRLSVEPGTGDDTVLGGAGDDELNGALGVDTVTGGEGDDTIIVGPGNDVAGGGAGDDRVVGGDGADQLGGDEGDDLLEGGDGNDILLGGAGSDTMLCGPGDDTSDDNEADDDTSRHCEHLAP